MTWDACQLARFSDSRCEGALIRAHLIPRQLLRREGLEHLVDDPRTFVMCCGGITGVGGHHGEFDYSRSLRIPRSAIPTATEKLAVAIGLAWYLDREYGPSANMDVP